MDQAQIVSNEQPTNPLDRVVVADEHGSITNARCQICSCEHRAFAEAMFDKQHPVSDIKKFLDEKGSVFAIWRIKHHFDTHYRNMAMQAAIAEYRDNLNEMMKRRRSMVSDMLFSIDIAWTELSNILVIPTDNDLDKTQKKQRMISDLLKTIKEGQEFIKSMNDSESKAKAAEERFVKVWQIKLDQAKDDAERKLLASTLQDFKDKWSQLGV